MGAQPGPDMDAEGFRRAWADLHGGVEPSGMVGGWLRLGYALAAPLARRRVPPDLVTLVALVVAGCAVPAAAGRGRWALTAAALIAASGVLDGLDGPVAVLQGRSSRWGYVLDSFCDRLAEAGFGAALYLAGASGWAAAGWVGLGWLQEYLRARAGGAGLTGITVVTVSERPTRIAVAAMFLLGAGVYPPVGPTWVGVGAVAGCAVGLIGLGQLLFAVRRALVAPPPTPPGSGTAAG